MKTKFHFPLTGGDSRTEKGSVHFQRLPGCPKLEEEIHEIGVASGKCKCQ